MSECCPVALGFPFPALDANLSEERVPPWCDVDGLSLGGVVSTSVLKQEKTHRLSHTSRVLSIILRPDKCSYFPLASRSVIYLSKYNSFIPKPLQMTTIYIYIRHMK